MSRWKELKPHEGLYQMPLWTLIRHRISTTALKSNIGEPLSSFHPTYRKNKGITGSLFLSITHYFLLFQRIEAFCERIVSALMKNKKEFKRVRKDNPGFL